MSDDKNTSPKTEKVDEELSDLLESALQDFSKEATTAKSDGKKTESKPKDEIAENTTNGPEWSDDFIQQAASQFEANFANILAGGDTSGVQLTPETIQQKLQQMAEAAQQVLTNPAQPVESSTDIASTITQAIQGLNEGAEGLQNPFSEDDLLRMFTGGQPGQDANDMVPFMQGMMQGLLSKDVLGPSLQDFVDRLPGYIESNREKLSPEEIERYENQKKLMQEVLEELQKEKDTDSTQEKSDRFTKVLALMQKLQDYGQPPAELVGDVEAPFNFDPTGQPNQDCSIM